MQAFFAQLCARYERISKFTITGGISAVVSLGTFIVLTEVVGVWYLAASITGYVASFFVNFFLQKFWTFRNTDTAQTHVQMGLFFVNSLWNLALNAALMYGLVDVLGIHHIAAQILVIGVLAVMNYTLYRFYIFRTTSHETPTS